MKTKNIISVLCLLNSYSAFAVDFTTTEDLSIYFKTPTQLLWGDPKLFDKGAHDSMLYSTPDGGAYTVRVKFPANFKVKPFYQENGIIHVTVLSGTLYIDSGTKFNLNSKGNALPEGSFLTIPSNIAIYMWTKNDPVVIQMNSDKVSKINYITNDD